MTMPGDYLRLAEEHKGNGKKKKGSFLKLDTEPQGGNQKQRRRDIVMDYIMKYGRTPSPEQIKAMETGYQMTGYSGPGEQMGAGEMFGEQPFVPPAMEEAFQRYAPGQVYQSRLHDYLSSRSQQDALNAERIYQQIEALKLQDANIRQKLKEDVARAAEQYGGIETYDKSGIEAEIDRVNEDIEKQKSGITIFRGGEKSRRVAELERYRDELKAQMETISGYESRIGEYPSQVEEMVGQYLTDWEDYFDRTMLDFKNTLAELMTDEKVNQILDEAQAMLGRGYYGEDLPLFADVAESLGPQTTALYNKIISESKQEYERNLPLTRERFEERGDIWSQMYPQNVYPEWPEWSPEKEIWSGEQPIYETGSEKQDYYKFISNAPPQYRNMLAGSFDYLFNAWQQSGTGQSFMDWLMAFIGG